MKVISTRFHMEQRTVAGKPVHVGDMNPDDLIRELGEVGITIYPAPLEQTTSYGGETRQNAPLGTVYPEGHDKGIAVIDYTLRGPVMEIGLEDDLQRNGVNVVIGIERQSHPLGGDSESVRAAENVINRAYETAGRVPV